MLIVLQSTCLYRNLTMALLLRLLCLAACALTILAKPLVANKKDWDKIDWDAAERALEEGDDPELLASEDAAKIASMEKRKAAGLVMPDGNVKLKDPTEWVRHTNAMTGPTMQFVTLRDSAAPVAKEGQGGQGGRRLPWSQQSKAVLEELTTRWKELLHTAGIEAACYDIGEGRVLVSLQEGWRGYELRDFLLAQPEVEEIEWDSVKYKGGEELGASVHATLTVSTS